MTLDAKQAFRIEAEFLSGVESNFEAAKGKHFRGSIWQRSQHDEGDRLRALLAAKGKPDRELLRSLPANRRVVLRGFDRWLGFWKKATGVAVASVLSPLTSYADDAQKSPPPIDVAELTHHVRQLQGDSRGPTYIIGVCSPSGFTAAARAARLGTAACTVILIEPDGQEGWRITPSGDSVDPRLLRIFDPESAKQKLGRVRRAIEARSADLLGGGLSVSELADELGLSVATVRQGVETAVAEDRELRTTQHDGELVIYRGAALKDGQERSSMSVIDRIRQMFSRSGDEARKIDLLTERRLALARRRDRMYEDIAKLEQKESELLAQGKAATSPVPKRRLAAQLAQLRRDIARHNTTAAMLNQQINILSTDIHNLTLIQQGEIARLPSTEHLTENAVRAEELLESLRADADLVGELGMGMEASLLSDEEQAILREFDGAEEKGEAAGTAKDVAKAANMKPAPAERSPARVAPLREAPRSAAPERLASDPARDSSAKAPVEGYDRPPARDAEKS